ncbi:MAG: VOC family protein [Christensenellales bacterium]|jgi:predicted enzyme related to lactoylglutathione lyase
MVFQGFGLITENVRRLRAFYEMALHCPARGDDIHTEILCEGQAFILYDKAASIADMGFSYDPAMGHGHTTLSFRVADVDAEYARLTQLGVDFMTKPRTYPWGARSAHFRDPDGNIVTIFAPAD